MFCLLALILSSLAVSAPASAAPPLYPIEGKVVDNKNVPIPGATGRLSSREPGPPLERPLPMNVERVEGPRLAVEKADVIDFDEE